MNLRSTLRAGRARSGLSLRQLAERAHTSHSTLAAYESGRVVPTVDTLVRIARAAGFDLALELTPLPAATGTDRGAELVEVLELAALFPARHEPTLTFPIFGRT